MRLLERLGVKDGPHSAAITLHEYVSDRSVALCLRSEPGALDIGSGICIMLGGRRFIATASHNIQDCEFSNVTVIARGERFGEPLQAKGMGCSGLQDRDVAWIEIDPSARLPGRLRFIAADQLASINDEIDLQPCLLQGYPSQRVELPKSADQRPFIESDGLFTLSIAPVRRRTPRIAGVDIAVEYPPHDRSIDDVLPPPPGVSGGGLWIVPRFDDGVIWSAENAKLVALARGWWRDEREELATRIECWLSLVGEQIPKLRDETDAVLRRLRLQQSRGSDTSY